MNMVRMEEVEQFVDKMRIYKTTLEFEYTKEHIEMVFAVSLTDEQWNELSKKEIYPFGEHNTESVKMIKNYLTEMGVKHG